jgi:hypothetical protein
MTEMTSDAPTDFVVGSGLSLPHLPAAAICVRGAQRDSSVSGPALDAGIEQKGGPAGLRCSIGN